MGIFKLLKVEKWHKETPRAPSQLPLVSCYQCPTGFLPDEGLPLKQPEHLSIAAVPTQETPPFHCIALGLQVGAFPQGLIPLMSLPVATWATALP